MFLLVPLVNPNPKGCIKHSSNASNWNNMLPQNCFYILIFFFSSLPSRSASKNVNWGVVEKPNKTNPTRSNTHTPPPRRPQPRTGARRAPLCPRPALALPGPRPGGTGTGRGGWVCGEGGVSAVCWGWGGEVSEAARPRGLRAHLPAGETPRPRCGAGGCAVSPFPPPTLVPPSPPAGHRLRRARQEPRDVPGAPDTRDHVQVRAGRRAAGARGRRAPRRRRAAGPGRRREPGGGGLGRWALEGPSGGLFVSEMKSNRLLGRAEQINMLPV